MLSDGARKSEFKLLLLYVQELFSCPASDGPSIDGPGFNCPGSDRKPKGHEPCSLHVGHYSTTSLPHRCMSSRRPRH